MPYIEVRGKYRTFRYDGDSPLDFTTYNNLLCVIRRPNINTFVTLQQYVPGQGGAFTSFVPGSSYTIVTRADGTQGNFNFDMGPYTRVDRLPASTFLKSPNFYIGLDKNSIVVPISSYALSVNSPLSSVVNIVYVNGQGNRLQYVYADNFKTGAPLNFTHFLPNSGYELRNRVPFTFFAPLQSEMGDAWATGNNTGGEYGMGYRHSNNSFPGDNIYGNWDKIVFNNLSYNCIDGNQTISAPSIAALSSCGTTKALFVLGNNVNGQLGTSSTQQYYPVWTRAPGQWLDVEMGRYHMLAINSQGHLYACGSNTFGQLGLGSGTARANTLTLVDATRNYVEVAATGLGSMARDSNGFLYACGSNREGKLGVGNNTSIIYTFTREALSYTWTSVKAGRPNVSSSDPSTDYFVAIRSNNTLYGVGTADVNSYFGSTNTDSIPYTFKQESLNFTDVTNVITTIKGTFIQRRNQNNYFAAGNNSSGNPLAIINNNTAITFLETYIPFDAIAVANYYNLTTTGIGTSYIRNSIRYSKTTGNSFTADTNNYNNIFTDASTTFTRRGLQPTPTPTITPTRTPTPTPTATPITLVPSDVPNAIFVSWYNSFGGSGDRAHLMRSTDAYNTATVMTNWAWLNGSSDPKWITRSCFDFKDSNNAVLGTFDKTGRVFKQIVKNSSTWSIPSALNDIVTAGTTIATWNSTDTNSPYYRGKGTSGTGYPVGKVDMFVHRNSNTAVYVFTQWRRTSDSDFQNGSTGAWTFTVNLANNAIGNTTALTNNDLSFNRWHDNTAYWYTESNVSPMPKTSRPLKKLPDGTVIFKSMYLTTPGGNYGALALIGRYDTPTWGGFTDSRQYTIPNSDDTQATNQSTYPAWAEFAKLGSNYYLAWCTKTKTDAQGIGGGFQSGYRTQANLVLRNLQSGTQVQVDTKLNTSTSTPFSNYGNLRLKPYDIIGDPSSNRIYVAYAKYTTDTGNPESNSNVLGIFVKRYDQNLNLIDTIQLFSYTGVGGSTFGPALVCPVFTYYVNANSVLKLILAFGSNSAGGFGGGTQSGDYIFTNTPSINNTWTQVFNQTAASNTNRIYMALGAGNDVISI